MNSIVEVVTFRRMIAPTILQILFWAAIGGTVYGSYVLYSLGNLLWPLPLIFGTLAARVIFETAILAYRVYDRLGEICTILRQAQSQ